METKLANDFNVERTPALYGTASYFYNIDSVGLLVMDTKLKPV